MLFLPAGGLLPPVSLAGDIDDHLTDTDFMPGVVVFRRSFRLTD
jgi:hypothetical protein